MTKRNMSTEKGTKKRMKRGKKESRQEEQRNFRILPFSCIVLIFPNKGRRRYGTPPASSSAEFSFRLSFLFLHEELRFLFVWSGRRDCVKLQGYNKANINGDTS